MFSRNYLNEKKHYKVSKASAEAGILEILEFLATPKFSPLTNPRPQVALRSSLCFEFEIKMAGGANVSDLEYLSDLVLVSSDGERFLVHKVFVAKYSVFFRNMFSECCATKPPAAKKKKDGKYGAVEAMETLKLDDVSSETMKPLISLMYCTTGSRSMKHISADNVKSLTEVARK